MHGSLSRLFDQPIGSIEHQSLADTAWMGGPRVTVRYWLGRILRRNLFRESDSNVTERLAQYIRDRGSENGAVLVADIQTWGPIALLLEHWGRLEFGEASKCDVRVVAALEAYVANPRLTNEEIARIAEMTEKQVVQNSELLLLRRAWEQFTSAT